MDGSIKHQTLTQETAVELNTTLKAATPCCGHVELHTRVCQYTMMTSLLSVVRVHL